MVNWDNYRIFDNRPRRYVVKELVGIKRVKKEIEIMCGPGMEMLELMEMYKDEQKENKMINGIKPKITTCTKLGIKPTSFDEAMTNFCNQLTENSIPEVERFDFMKSVTFKACGGRKYIKVKYFTDKFETNWETMEKKILVDKNGSIHCFVDSTTGDIYKPQTWRAPYTKGNNAVRGNIYDSSSFEKTDMHGGWLYAK